MAGGKSRKAGGVSKKLIEALKYGTYSSSNKRGKGKKGKNDKKVGLGLVPEEDE